ncbi:MAG: LysM peptidoglycan-binding domain-containing protein [Gammaproteobacteria bacterium]|nr:LysM peptidoglycan-binding domain-containing protein [Gammaproteobacteria bacterium]
MNKKNLIKFASLFAMVGLLTACPGPEKPSEEPTPVAPTTQAEEPKVEAPANDTYLVVRGDSLWKISGKPDIYNNPYHWPLIYKANRDKINDADLIQPGQELTIERGNSVADVDAAVEHAKTRGAWSIGVVEETDKAYLNR